MGKDNLDRAESRGKIWPELRGKCPGPVLSKQILVRQAGKGEPCTTGTKKKKGGCEKSRAGNAIRSARSRITGLVRKEAKSGREKEKL